MDQVLGHVLEGKELEAIAILDRRLSLFSKARCARIKQELLQKALKEYLPALDEYQEGWAYRDALDELIELKESPSA